MHWSWLDFNQRSFSEKYTACYLCNVSHLHSKGNSWGGAQRKRERGIQRDGEEDEK